MPTLDPRIDRYIAEAPEFARPILQHLRQLIHRGCPEIVETIKWGSPFFDCHGILCGMAAFKAHCSLFFWRDIAIDHLFPKTNTGAGGMGQFGKLSSLSDLPKDSVLLACVRSAVAQRLSPASKPKRARRVAKEPPVPPDLKKALAANAPARKTFQAFAPSHRREYIEWITEAKRPETRAQRLATTLEWLTAGKQRNWKYREQRAKAPR